MVIGMTTATKRDFLFHLLNISKLFLLRGIFMMPSQALLNWMLFQLDPSRAQHLPIFHETRCHCRNMRILQQLLTRSASGSAL